MLGLSSWQLICKALTRQALSPHSASAVFLVYSSTVAGQSSLVEKRTEAVPWVCFGHMTYTLLMRHSWGVGLFFLSLLCAYVQVHTHTHTHSPPTHTLTLAPRPHTCLCIGYLWKDRKKPVTVTTSGKRGMESWGIGVEKPLFHKTIEFCFKFIMIVEYPINTKEYIEYVLQQQCIQYTNPWTHYPT